MQVAPAGEKINDGDKKSELRVCIYGKNTNRVHLYVQSKYMPALITQQKPLKAHQLLPSFVYVEE